MIQHDVIALAQGSDPDRRVSGSVARTGTGSELCKPMTAEWGQVSALAWWGVGVGGGI